MTEKQKLFAETYLANGFNARDAYFSSFGNNGNKQPSYPYTLLKQKEISEYIKKRRKEIYESLNVDATRVMQELADIAFEIKNEKNVTSKLKALEILSKNLALQTVKTENKEVIEVNLVEDDLNE